MGSIGNAIGGIVSPIVGGITGATQMGEAAQNVGLANLGQQQSDRNSALGYVNAATPQMMQQLQQSITTNNQQIAQSQALINSADPALVQAGQQALALMQGKSAASLAPLQSQQALQRQQLQQSLAAQLGPDYATSSQGMAALNQFDQQAQLANTQAQQGAIGQYMGYAGQAANLGMQGQQQGINNSQNIGQGYGNIAGLQMSAINGTPVNAGQAYQGALTGAASTTGTMNSLLGGAASAGGAAAGKALVAG